MLLRADVHVVCLALFTTLAGVGGVAYAQATDGIDPDLAASRAQALAVANTAYQHGDLASALQLYQEVSRTPPGDTETLAESDAIDGLAGFREIIILAAADRDDDAREQLYALEQREANAPLTRLGAQFWDQYGMTALPRAACAQLGPQIASQAQPVLAILAGLGAGVDADSLCSIPT